MSQYATGKKAAGICDYCGFRYKLRELREVVKNRVPTNLRACPQCWDQQHPQEDLGLYRIEDAQALRDPRPDTAELPSSRALVFQVSTAVEIALSRSGGVTIT